MLSTAPREVAEEALRTVKKKGGSENSGVSGVSEKSDAGFVYLVYPIHPAAIPRLVSGQLPQNPITNSKEVQPNSQPPQAATRAKRNAAKNAAKKAAKKMAKET